MHQFDDNANLWFMLKCFFAKHSFWAGYVGGYLNFFPTKSLRGSSFNVAFLSEPSCFHVSQAGHLKTLGRFHFLLIFTFVKEILDVTRHEKTSRRSRVLDYVTFIARFRLPKAAQ